MEDLGETSMCQNENGQNKIDEAKWTKKLEWKSWRKRSQGHTLTQWLDDFRKIAGQR